VNTLAWILFCHPLKIVNESLLTIRHCWVVLNVNLSNIPVDSLGRIIVVKHQVVEGHYVLFVMFKMLLVCHNSLTSSFIVIGHDNNG
jgi:hypothetical protein